MSDDGSSSQGQDMAKIDDRDVERGSDSDTNVIGGRNRPQICRKTQMRSDY